MILGTFWLFLQVGGCFGGRPSSKSPVVLGWSKAGLELV